MEKKINYKQIIIIGDLILLVLSLLSKFIYFSDDGVVTHAYITLKVAGVYGALAGLCILVFAVGTKNRWSLLIGYLTSFVGYGITLYKTITILSAVTGILDYQIFIGFYLYYATMIILIISLFVKNVDHFESDKNKNSEFNDKLKNIDRDAFVIGNILLGYKEIPYNDVVLLKLNGKELSLLYKDGDKVSEKKIAISDIKEMKWNPDVSINYEMSINSSDTANMLLAFSFATGPVGGFVGYKMLGFLTEDYNKAGVRTTFVINLTYMDQGNEHMVKIVTVKNPNLFVRKVMNK